MELRKGWIYCYVHALTAAVILSEVSAKGYSKCEPVYVRWSKAALDRTSRVSGNYAIEDCQKACTGQYHPANERYKFACTSFNFRQNPRKTNDRECELFREDQLQDVDHDVVAREDFSFYRRYCVKTKKACKSNLFQFDLVVDSYMEQSAVARRLPSLSIEACLALCLEETSFTCRSVSYNRTGLECMLSGHNRLSKPGQVRLNNNPNWRVDYYENNCYNDSFSFSHKCQSRGVSVEVSSKYPYTGVLYGLYDFFTCRVEPKASSSFHYFFPFPHVSSNCTDSMNVQGKDIVLDVVLSADGVQPLYFLTDEDIIYQAKCKDPLQNDVGSSSGGSGSGSGSSSAIVGSVGKSTTLGLRIDSATTQRPAGGDRTEEEIPWWKQSVASTKSSTTPYPTTTISSRLISSHSIPRTEFLNFQDIPKPIIVKPVRPDFEPTPTALTSKQPNPEEDQTQATKSRILNLDRSTPKSFTRAFITRKPATTKSKQASAASLASSKTQPKAFYTVSVSDATPKLPTATEATVSPSPPQAHTNLKSELSKSATVASQASYAVTGKSTIMDSSNFRLTKEPKPTTSTLDFGRVTAEYGGPPGKSLGATGYLARVSIHYGEGAAGTPQQQGSYVTTSSTVPSIFASSAPHRYSSGGSVVAVSSSKNTRQRRPSIYKTRSFIPPISQNVQSQLSIDSSPAAENTKTAGNPGAGAFSEGSDGGSKVRVFLPIRTDPSTTTTSRRTTQATKSTPRPEQSQGGGVTKWWESITQPRDPPSTTTTTDAPSTRRPSTTRRTAPWWWNRTVKPDDAITTTTAKPTTTTRRRWSEFTTRSRAATTTTQRKTQQTTTTARKTTTTTARKTTTTKKVTTTTQKPTTTTTLPPEPVSLQIKSNDVQANAVLVNSPITLTFTSTRRGEVSASQMSLISCKVEPTRSRFSYSPVNLIENGCSTDGVGLVERIQKNPQGLFVKMGPLRYTDSAETMYTCKVRVCKVQCPTFSCLSGEARPYISYGRRRRRRQITNIRQPTTGLFAASGSAGSGEVAAARRSSIAGIPNIPINLPALGGSGANPAALGGGLSTGARGGASSSRISEAAVRLGSAAASARSGGGGVIGNINVVSPLLRNSAGLNPSIPGLGGSRNEWDNIEYEEFELTKKLVVLNSQYALNYYLKTGLILPEEEQQFASG